VKSHLLALLLFSGLTSTVFAALMREDLPSQIRFGLKAFALFVGSTLVVGWLMYPFPG